jgi:hypothetical protein
MKWHLWCHVNFSFLYLILVLFLRNNRTNSEVLNMVCLYIKKNLSNRPLLKNYYPICMCISLGKIILLNKW